MDGLNSDDPNPDYDATLSGQFLGSSYAANFTVDDPSSITTGTGSTYGNNNIGTGSGTPAGGAIPINSKNWLFGDFDQRSTSSGVSGKGIRDFSDLAIAQQAQAALNASGEGVNWNVGAGSNASNIPGLPAEMNNTYTKGDLIVLGDFDSDGDFDGKDLYRMARGIALADNTGSNVLTTASGADFGDMVRNGVLRKNAALDWLDANATAQQMADASFDGIASADDANAFNKFDVNRDGNVDLEDAGLVDAFVGFDYRDLEDQLAAVVATNLDPAGTRFIGDPTDPGNTTPRKPISLVDVELNDTGDITSNGENSDFGLIKTALGSLLVLGDTDFDGDVDLADLSNLASNYGMVGGSKWSWGDFDLDGDVDLSDLSSLAAFYGAGEAQAFADFAQLMAVPEPGSLAILGLLAVGAGARRRRND